MMIGRTSSQSSRAPATKSVRPAHLTQRRSAVALLAALICLLIVGLFSGVLVRGMVVHSQQSAVFQRDVQSLWLVESGLQRAIAKLATNPEYQGEHWELPAKSLGTAWPGQIIIHVETQPMRTGFRKIHVIAQYPLPAELRITHHREALFPITKTGEPS